MILLLDWLEAHPGLASWTQGLFTAAALWFALWQSAGGARAARKRDRAFILAALVPANGSINTVKALIEELRAPSYTPEDQAAIILHIRFFESMLEALDSIPLHQAPDEGCINSVLTIKSILRTAEQDLKAGFSTFHANPEDWARKLHASLEGPVGELRSAHDRAVRGWLQRKLFPSGTRRSRRTAS